jgi:hypothetical protein
MINIILFGIKLNCIKFVYYLVCKYMISNINVKTTADGETGHNYRCLLSRYLLLQHERQNYPGFLVPFAPI